MPPSFHLFSPIPVPFPSPSRSHPTGSGASSRPARLGGTCQRQIMHTPTEGCGSWRWHAPYYTMNMARTDAVMESEQSWPNLPRPSEAMSTARMAGWYASRLCWHVSIIHRVRRAWCSDFLIGQQTINWPVVKGTVDSSFCDMVCKTLVDKLFSYKGLTSKPRLPVVNLCRPEAMS